MAAEESGGIRLIFSSELSLPSHAWQDMAPAWEVVDGLIRVNGLEAAPEARFFRAVEME